MGLASGWEVGHYVSMLGNQTILILWIHTAAFSWLSSLCEFSKLVLLVGTDYSLHCIKKSHSSVPSIARLSVIFLADSVWT